MRILTVSNVPLEAHLGSGYVVTGCVERLRARGHEVVALAPGDYEWLPRVRVAKRLRMLCGYSWATLRALRAAPFDVVELWGVESWWVAGRLARRAIRPRLAGRSNGLEPHFNAELTRHGITEDRGPRARGFDRLQNLGDAFRRVDGLTTPSHFDARYALQQGYQPAERLITMEVPLREDWLGQAMGGGRPRVLGFCGGMLRNKGGDLLAAALPVVLRAQPDWRARFLGVDHEWLAGRVPADVASRVEAIPFVSERERLRAWFRDTAVVAMPSAYESLGIAAAEAMSCGCALVATPTGFAADLKPGIEALLVTERTSVAWTAALGEIMADDEGRRRIARNGHARVQSLRWQDYIRTLESFHRGLVERSK